MNKSIAKPARLKAILWMMFSGTASLCALILPAFVILTCTGVNTCNRFSDAGLMNPESLFQNWPWGEWTRIGLFAVILLAAAYHSIYRIIASEKDLHLSKPLIILTLLILIIAFI